MKCITCGKGPADGTSVYRQNAKGVAGIWACEEHSKPVDPGLVELVHTLEQRPTDADIAGENQQSTDDQELPGMWSSSDTTGGQHD